MKWLFDTNERKLKKYRDKVKKINGMEKEIIKLSDEELKLKFSKIKEKIKKSKNKTAELDKHLPEVFALVREASKRVLGMRHYDVQLIGGMVLHEGKIAEMKTGEGKTLTATLPAVLNAIVMKTYIITVNDYLAKRDMELMKPLYEFFGFKIGKIHEGQGFEEKKEAYDSDIIYATNTEFGFDFLRDNLALSKSETVQKELGYAIIDEIDSILIDEARTPLIISSPKFDFDNQELYYQIDEIIKQLSDKDYVVDIKNKNAYLTEEGYNKIEAILGLNLYDPQNVYLTNFIHQSLIANYVMKKDRDYIIKNGKIEIIDEHTGRIAEGRKFSEGLHQALEAKEGLPISEENETLASITYPYLFGYFKKVAGMTGTAKEEETEFRQIYGLEVISIPTNKPVIRKDLPDKFYFSSKKKYEDAVKKIKELHKKGQPVLIGTTSVEESEYLSKMLKKENIPHTVLNAKHHEKEAEIIAKAGQKGAVTVATNMAGRGVDIKLDEEAKKLGGLFVLGVSRHESRRIDNQLRGRSGRQGDPGVSQFYVSLEDPLIQVFGNPSLIKRLKLNEENIESKILSKLIKSAQDKIRDYYYEIRKNLLKYDSIDHNQRDYIWKQRKELLENLDNKESGFINDIYKKAIKDVAEFMQKQVKEDFFDEKLEDFINKKLFSPDFAIMLEENEKKSDVQILGKDKEDEITKLQYVLFEKFHIFIEYSFLKAKIEEFGGIAEFLEYFLDDFIQNKYKDFDELLRKQIFGTIFLQVLDKHWREHVTKLHLLKEGINLRAIAQKDPIVEYKEEAFYLFKEFITNVKIEFIKNLLEFNPQNFIENNS